MPTSSAYRANRASESPCIFSIFRFVSCLTKGLTKGLAKGLVNTLTLFIALSPAITLTASAQTVDEAQPSSFLGTHNQSPSVSGVAYSLKTFRPLYQEQYFASAAGSSDNHTKQGAPSRIRVVYSSVQASQSVEGLERTVLQRPLSVDDARVFAIKDIDYSDSSSAPYYRMTDFRQGQIQAAIGESDALLSLQLYGFLPRFPVNAAQEQTSKEGISDPDAYMPLNLSARPEIENTALGIEQLKSGQAQRSGLVTDAGFDNYVRENWSALIDNQQKLAFVFAVPSRGQSVAMTIKALSAEECAERVKQDVPADLLGSESVDSKSSERCLKLEAKNWIIAKVLKPIYLVYDQQRRLQWFRGLSNIRGQNNEKLRVLIKYTHAA